MIARDENLSRDFDVKYSCRHKMVVTYSLRRNNLFVNTNSSSGIFTVSNVGVLSKQHYTTKGRRAHEIVSSAKVEV